MTIQIDAEPALLDEHAIRRRLVLIWREPSSRRFVRVARLDVMRSGGYRFEYEPSVEDLHDFARLDEYPGGQPPRVVNSLPAFFRNRVMSSERHSYSQYLSWFALDGPDLAAADVPLELLVRSGGGRVTDTFHVVEAPVFEDGVFVTRFFVSGISHVEGADVVVAGLTAGDPLVLRDEPDNPTNSLAIALDSIVGRELGWVPDWLCGEVQHLRSLGYEFRATVERVNLDAPIHVRVLCRIEGVRAATRS